MLTVIDEYTRESLEIRVEKNITSKHVPNTISNLLYAAIFANTLNFNASVTTQRDILAFEKLKNFIDLPKHWIEQYYSEVEKRIFENFDKSIKNDTKILSNGWAIAQIELYDAVSILNIL